MTLAFIERPPTPQDVERLRLILSTYQDGTGMLATKSGLTLPGWRDFERSVAIAFEGNASESKSLFDVLFKASSNSSVRYGLSCKMRQELNRIGRDGRVTIELSNSAGQFWDQLVLQNIDAANYKDNPQIVGQTVVDLVKRWHQNVSLQNSGLVDLSKSFYLVLSWNNAGLYQLHQFSLQLPDPMQLNWYFPATKSKGIEKLARHLNDDDANGRVFEWYGESGGQLKYYPLAASALWQSETFQLEPLPDIEHGVLAKARAYFPHML